MSSNRKMQVYKAKDGWRWRLWKSSDIVAESGGAYENKSYAIAMAKTFAPSPPDDTEFEIEETSDWISLEVEPSDEENE